MHLFWEKGYGSTSVADILKSADINSGSLYHYFPGKQDVLVAALETYQGGLWEMLLKPAWESVAAATGRICPLRGRNRGCIAEPDCAYGCPIARLDCESDGPDPVVPCLLVNN